MSPHFPTLQHGNQILVFITMSLAFLDSTYKEYHTIFVFCWSYLFHLRESGYFNFMALKFMLDPLHLVGQKGKNIWEIMMRGTHLSTHILMAGTQSHGCISLQGRSVDIV